MATSTDKLAPRIIINEHDISQKRRMGRKHPITLIFGFAPLGRMCEMVECNTLKDIQEEFGSPVSAPEKYFIDSAMRLVQNDATVLMTRLPYDNDQAHNVKYIDYRLEDSISMRDIATVPMETKTRQTDDVAVTVLKAMHRVDSRMTQVQRISQVANEAGELIGTMTNEQLVDLELDPQANLGENIFRIVDIKGDQYGVGAAKQPYTGIFPMLVTAPMAMYYQGLLQNTTEMDESFKMVDLGDGLQMSTYWFKHSDPVDDNTKKTQAEIVESIKQVVNISTQTNRFKRNESFQDSCTRRFPRLGLLEKGKLERAHMKEIGVLVCGVNWDSDTQQTTLTILESFVGKLGRATNSVDRKINAQSKYIRMYKNIQVPVETDFYVVNNQKIASLGWESSDCEKLINYKTSIIDPLTHVLESVYSDVDSIQIDAILDAGLSSTAFAAYVDKNPDGEQFKNNDLVDTVVDWSSREYSIDDNVVDYAKVWTEITKLFGDFIRNVRGDCVYIADGPRILNLERNYPISRFIDMDNVDLFNAYLPEFNGYTNNYVARYWNWVYMEDMQWLNRGFWVPGSVVMGSQLAANDHGWQIWNAPAGQTRGLIDEAYDVSVKTKQYNSENDILYSNQWNFFNIYQNEGVVVDGQKTLQTKKTSLDRLNVRRMVCHIKQRLREISNRYKYEPHTKSLRESYVKEICAMLHQIQRTDGISDYRVLCDETNNTIESIDRHELWCKVGIKPIKAIEYIVIDLNIINGNVGMGENQVILKED